MCWFKDKRHPLQGCGCLGKTFMVSVCSPEGTHCGSQMRSEPAWQGPWRANGTDLCSGCLRGWLARREEKKR